MINAHCLWWCGHVTHLGRAEKVAVLMVFWDCLLMIGLFDSQWSYWIRLSQSDKTVFALRRSPKESEWSKIEHLLYPTSKSHLFFALCGRGAGNGAVAYSSAGVSWIPCGTHATPPRLLWAALLRWAWCHHSSSFWSAFEWKARRQTSSFKSMPVAYSDDLPNPVCVFSMMVALCCLAWLFHEPLAW